MALRLLFAAVAGLIIASVPAAAVASGPAIDSLVVKFRDGVIVEQSAGLPVADRAALDAALQAPYSHVGYTPNGALKLQLSNPVALDAARAAVNRVRMLPQVLYASIVPPATGVAASAAATVVPAWHPPVRRFIVKFRDAATSAAARRNEPLASAQVNRLTAMAGKPFAHERAMAGGSYVVRLLQSLPVDQARALAAYLATDSTIEYAEPDLLMQPQLVPNDPSYPSQWHYLSPPAEMGGVNLPAAWDLSTGAANLFVAIIDTGILYAHPDLAGRIVGGYDFISDSTVGNDGDGRDADPSDPGDWVTVSEDANGILAGCGVRDSTFHGTHVAGTIGAVTGNATGVAGINWVSKIVPARALGKCGGFSSDIVDAISWSAGISVPGVPNNPYPARVINMSLGGSGACGSSYQSAIDAAIAAGAVIVVAAGNGSADASNASPANCAGVITVGATGRAGQRASYTNYGTLVEISAPGGSDGESVLSTINNSATAPALGSYTYGYLQGTSMATPHVAGIASLMLSVTPSLTPAQVLSKIQTTARAFPTGTIRDCTTALCGAGIINAAAAVASAAAGVASVTLASSLNPAAVGASVTFTASVSGVAPTGTVNFTSGGTTISGCGAVQLAGTGSSRTAICTTSSLANGTYSIVATYSGDGSNPGSTSTALSQIIRAALGGPLTSGVPVTGIAGSADTELRFTLGVPAGATNLRFTIAGGTGDADMYVRFGSAPTTTLYDCRPYVTGNNETCTFATAQAGTYHVLVHAYTAITGVTLTGSYALPAANVPPTANFTFTTSGLTASFTDTSTDSDGTIAARSWTFGDGATSTATNPSRTYATAGTYSVGLTVTDNLGATNTVTKSVTVSAVAPPPNVLTNGVPVAGLSGSANTELRYTMVVPAGMTNLRFTITGGTGDADLYVRFGAAPTTGLYDCRPYVTGNNETCTFATAQAGTYYVMVHAYTAISGVTLTGSYTLPAANVPPTANFTFTTSGLTASFTDTSTDSDGTIAARSWTFGDGATSTATNPSRTYATAGTYSVGLTVTDNLGATNTVTKSVTVSAVAPPPNVLTNGVPVAGLSGSANTELRYTMVVPAGMTNLRFTITGGTGDADLYVRFGAAPTTGLYDCRPYTSGNSETCTIAAAQAGTYYVMVRGYASFAGVTLTATY